MRQFFRMLLLALVLITVALVSALTAMRLAIHGREVTVPKLVGMSPLAGERAGAASRLVDPRGSKFGASAGGDSQRDGRQRAGRRVEHTAPWAESWFDRAHQFAGRAAGPGDIAKPG